MTLAESLQPSISITIRFLQNIFPCKLCSDEILVFLIPWSLASLHLAPNGVVGPCTGAQGSPKHRPPESTWELLRCQVLQTLINVDMAVWCLPTVAYPPLGLVSLHVASNTTEDFRNGAPGRGPLQQPWDSLKGPNEEGLTPIWTCFIRDRFFF